MSPLDLSIIIPTLNEEKSVGICVSKAYKAIAALGLKGEVLVADHRSTDRTVEIAEKLGARIVRVEEKGYGNAYLSGVPAAQSDFIIMGDADDSYNFEEIGPFYEKLKAGYDFVMGSRFKGKIERGAMPFLHRHLGTPFLTFIINLFFKTNISDSNCGMRSFTKKAFETMDLKTTGMEFASEMVIKAGLLRLKIAEVPCNLYRDKRGRPPHLRPWRDGWRNLRFILLFTPKWNFLIPGSFLSIAGLLGLITLTLRDICHWNFPYLLNQKHMISSAILFLMGSQIIAMGLTAKIFSYSRNFKESGPLVEFLNKYFQLEKGIVLGLLSVFSGLLIFIYLFVSFNWGWFYRMSEALRFDMAIFGMVGIFTGVQIVFVSFLLSLFYLKIK